MKHQSKMKARKQNKIQFDRGVQQPSNNTDETWCGTTTSKRPILPPITNQGCGTCSNLPPITEQGCGTCSNLPLIQIEWQEKQDGKETFVVVIADKYKNLADSTIGYITNIFEDYSIKVTVGGYTGIQLKLNTNEIGKALIKTNEKQIIADIINLGFE